MEPALRVVIFTQHFAPEVTAGRFRMEAFARRLVERGHEVRVVCPVPNHPQGVVRPGYETRALRRRQVDGIEVDHVRVAVSAAKTLRHRLAYYGSYAAMAGAVGSAMRRPDVILATSPPLTVGAAAALVAARHRVPWVLDVRDLWPEVAVTLGEVRPGALVAGAEWLERRLYRSATRVVTVTEPFRQTITHLSGDPAKVLLIPNGTTRAWLEAGERDVPRQAVGIPRDRFVWTYAGNVGLSHGLEVAIEAAARLGEGFQLLVIGEGPLRESLERKAAELPAGTVGFRPLVEAGQLARVLRASDALLAIQRGALTKVVSSKLYDYCAVGRPVLAVAEGEMRRLVEARGAALGVPAQDPEALADAIRRLSRDRGLRARLASEGRRFAAEHLREHQAERLAAELELLAAARDPS
ncbi:MAG: glycosyltransferase family 4 protein [Solirubrobacterales bacterium]